MRNYQRFENPDLSTSQTPKALSRGMPIILDASREDAKFCVLTLQYCSVWRGMCPPPPGIWIHHTLFIPDIPRCLPICMSPVAVFHFTPSIHVRNLVRARSDVISLVPSITPLEEWRPFKVVRFWSPMDVRPSRPPCRTWFQRGTIYPTNEYIWPFSCENVF